MTEFSARKLGEVLAFARIGTDTIERGRTALETVFGGAEGVDALLAANAQHAAEIEAMALAAGVSETTLAKAEGTAAKLGQMRDLYVGDQWDNAVELMEWSGFFVGAAIVHWSLVAGAAEGLDSDAMGTLAHQALGFHQGVFDTVNVKIAEYARNRETGQA